MKTHNSLFIVIDGSDGSGKETQSKLLRERLEKETGAVELFSFPRYGNPAAALAEKYLKGGYGETASSLDAQQASVLFAVDRFDAGFEIRTALMAGKHVIADRWTTANAGHQGSKMKNKGTRIHFFKWLATFEYDYLKMPVPSLNIILLVEPEISAQLRKDRTETDIHEKDAEHLRLAYRAFTEIPDYIPNTVAVRCTKNGKMLSREEIHERIWKEVKKKL